MKQSIIVIEAPTFFTQLALRDGVVVTAAPNVDWLRGKDEAEVVKCCRREGWCVQAFEPKDTGRKPS